MLLQKRLRRMKPLVLRQPDGAAFEDGQRVEAVRLLLKVFFQNDPVLLIETDEAVVEGSVEVRAERQSVGDGVVASVGKRRYVGCLDHGHIGEDAQAARQ